jgi:hypothetical protein
MLDFLFLLAVSGLVAASLSTRIIVSKGIVDGLPPMPHEH